MIRFVVVVVDVLLRELANKEAFCKWMLLKRKEQSKKTFQNGSDDVTVKSDHQVYSVTILCN